MKRRREPREPTEEEQELFINVKHCARELDDILQGARRKCEKNSEVFAQSHVSMMFRGVSSYAHLYEKLGHLSREKLEDDLRDHWKCDEVQNAHDDILETEGLWANLLSNVDKELRLVPSSDEEPSCPREGEKLDEKMLSIQVTDWKSRQKVSLQQVLKPHRLLLLLCQPAYLPPVIVRWYLDQIALKEADFKRFRLSIAVILWGPKEKRADETDNPTVSVSPFDHLESYLHRPVDAQFVMKEWFKSAKLPQNFDLPLSVYFDSERRLLKRNFLLFQKGLSKVWHCPNLQFYGQQQSAGRSVHPPLENVHWTDCLELGGAMLVSHSGKILIAHASEESVGDLPPIDRLYQVALVKYAHSIGQPEEEVRRRLHQERVRHCPPDMTRLQYECSSGMYYDPETEFYYDASTQYFYDVVEKEYLYWNAEQCSYLSAKPLFEEAQRQHEAVQQYYEAQVAAYDSAIEETKRHLVEEEETERILRETAVTVAIAKAQQSNKQTAPATDTNDQPPQEEVIEQIPVTSSTNTLSSHPPPQPPPPHNPSPVAPSIQRIIQEESEDLKPPGT